MEWFKCSERQPLKNRLLLLFVDGDYEFGQLQEDDFYIYTNGAFKKRYAPQEVTHWAMLNHPELPAPAGFLSAIHRQIFESAHL